MKFRKGKFRSGMMFDIGSTIIELKNKVAGNHQWACRAYYKGSFIRREVMYEDIAFSESSMKNRYRV